MSITSNPRERRIAMLPSASIKRAAANGVTADDSPRESKRIVSMDQFRGYAVAGMFVVNFLGGMAVTHQLLAHNNTHFSWADSIMPGFLFACGFSYRLSVLKRVPRLGRMRTYAGIIRRALALVLISLVMYGFGSGFRSWEAMTQAGVRQFLAELLKADFWEVLAIIGATQIFLLPVIELSPRMRLAAAVAFSLGHALLSWSFNYEFVFGLPNWMDANWGAVGKRAWDGGFFGIISWAIPMLAGTLVYDLIASRGSRRALGPLLGWGLSLMLLGYGLSCLTRLYDMREENPVAVASPSSRRFAASPVLPPWENARGRTWESLLAEPPFVPPPPVTERKWNYWMMNKRVVTQSFTLFATGFSCVVYALFVLACDIGNWRLGLFGTFGQNALAAYIIHHPIREMVQQVVPADSPVWWVATGLVMFLIIIWMFVRYLQQNRIFVRL